MTIGPAFLAGSVYLCFARIVVVQGRHISRFSPRTYAILFMSCDFTCLLLQGAGGGISATSTTLSVSNIGRYIMIAGLAFQVFSLATFITFGLDFVVCLRRIDENSRDSRFAHLRASRRFKAFNLGESFRYIPVVEIFSHFCSALFRYNAHLDSLNLSSRRAASGVLGSNS